MIGLVVLPNPTLGIQPEEGFRGKIIKFFASYQPNPQPREGS